MLLIIDCRVGYNRRDTLIDLCSKRHADVRCVIQVWGDVEVDNEEFWPKFDTLIADASLVLLHGGPDQLFAADALRREVLAGKNCLAFYGGASPHVDVKRYFSEHPSETHALVPERLALALKADSDDAEKLGKCLDLILKDKRLPPGAVEHVYGDPGLEGALDELYKMLADGRSIDDIRKRRDKLLPQDPWGEPC